MKRFSFGAFQPFKLSTTLDRIMSEDYLVHLFTTRIKAKGTIDPKISTLAIDEKRALLRVDDIDDESLHKYLLDRLASTDKLIESQNQVFPLLLLLLLLLCLGERKNS